MKLTSSTIAIIALAVVGQVVPALAGVAAVCAFLSCQALFFDLNFIQPLCCPKKVHNASLTKAFTLQLAGIDCWFGQIRCMYVSTKHMFLSRGSKCLTFR